MKQTVNADVLVVDDEVDIRDLVAGILEEAFELERDQNLVFDDEDPKRLLHS